MSELDGHGGRDHPLVVGVPELGRQQHQHGPQALAARLDEVCRGLGQHLMLGARGDLKPVLDLFQPGGDISRQGRVVQLYSSGDHSGSLVG